MYKSTVPFSNGVNVIEDAEPFLCLIAFLSLTFSHKLAFGKYMDTAAEGWLL